MNTNVEVRPVRSADLPSAVFDSILREVERAFADSADLKDAIMGLRQMNSAVQGSTQSVDCVHLEGLFAIFENHAMRIYTTLSGANDQMLSFKKGICA